MNDVDKLNMFRGFLVESPQMRFAPANGQRTEVYPRGKATCRRCGDQVIAKCGTRRVSHWAHVGMRDCDAWAEKETDWHRAWKNRFPAECQEVVLHDQQSGEKHIADVRTSHGLVIECQHSPLDPQERAAANAFTETWCGLLMARAWNETIHGLIKERVA